MQPHRANDAKGGPVGTNEVSNRGQVFKTKLGRKPRMGQSLRPMVLKRFALNLAQNALASIARAAKGADAPARRGRK